MTDHIITAGELTSRHIGKRIRVAVDLSMPMSHTGVLTRVAHQHNGVEPVTALSIREFAHEDHTTSWWLSGSPVSLIDADDRSPLDGQEALL